MIIISTLLDGPWLSPSATLKFFFPALHIPSGKPKQEAHGAFVFGLGGRKGAQVWFALSRMDGRKRPNLKRDKSCQSFVERNEICDLWTNYIWRLRKTLDPEGEPIGFPRD